MHTPQINEPVNWLCCFQYRVIAHIFQGKPVEHSKKTARDSIDGIYLAALSSPHFSIGRHIAAIILDQYDPCRSAQRRWTQPKASLPFITVDQGRDHSILL
tara:strand:- start:251 stop:553 length:303 start_codon:yes stop_codon:yes gene_type:complete